LIKPEKQMMIAAYYRVLLFYHLISSLAETATGGADVLQGADTDSRTRTATGENDDGSWLKPSSSWSSLSSSALTPIDLGGDSTTASSSSASAAAALSAALRQRRRRAIIRGNPAKKGEFPFFVMASGCGGTLVHRDVVVTAKHCRKVFMSGNTVFVGAIELSSPTAFWFSDGNGGPGSERHKTGRGVEHPGLDLMVVSLRKFSKKRPAILNGRGMENPNGTQSLRVVGFGTTENSSFSKRLKKVTVTHVPGPECQLERPNVDVNKYVCASQVERGACWGDSGGPLLDARVGKRRILLGVVSAGPDKCLSPTEPGIYVRVGNPATKNWIKKQICRLSKGKPKYCPRRKKK